MDEGAKSATVIHMKKENYIMNLYDMNPITKIYGFIRTIIANNEPQSKDELEVLDQIFGW